MTEQELEERIKEKTDTIMGKLLDLNDRYNGNITSDKLLFLSLCVICREMGIVMNRASIHFDTRDLSRPNMFKMCSISVPFIPFATILSFLHPQKDMSPISLQDAYNFVDNVEKSLEFENQIKLLADKIEKEQQA